MIELECLEYCDRLSHGQIHEINSEDIAIICGKDGDKERREYHGHYSRFCKSKPCPHCGKLTIDEETADMPSTIEIGKDVVFFTEGESGIYVFALELKIA